MITPFGIATRKLRLDKGLRLLDLAKKLGIQKSLYAVENTRGRISKKSMIHNDATPKIEVDPETYEVHADGELLPCAPAAVLPMAQRYFMF